MSGYMLSEEDLVLIEQLKGLVGDRPVMMNFRIEPDLKFSWKSDTTALIVQNSFDDVTLKCDEPKSFVLRRADKTSALRYPIKEFLTMATVPDSHSVLVCVQELIRLSRDGNLISLEGFGHVVDILQYVRSTLGGGAVLPMTADDEAALLVAAEELACELGVDAELQQQVEQFRFRPRPEEPAAPDEVVLPASGLLLTILLNLLTKWMSDPAMQAKLLAWIISLFGGGQIPMPATQPE